LASHARTHHDDPYRVPADYLACKIGMWFCLRKSEYLPNNKHPSQPAFAKGLPLSDLTFTDIDGRAIAHSMLRPGAAQRVTLNIRFSKTDQHGRGRPRSLCRSQSPPSPSTTTYSPLSSTGCLVAEIETWVIALRDAFSADTTRDHLFVVGPRIFVTADRVATVIKTTVLHLGLDPKRYTPHSLRYGGATMLASAGIPLYLIEYHGDWSPGSTSLRTYLQIGSDESDRLVTDVFCAAERSGSLTSVYQRHALL
jgi:hypothetical protein